MRAPRIRRPAFALLLLFFSSGTLGAQEATILPLRTAPAAGVGSGSGEAAQRDQSPLLRRVSLDMRDVSLETLLDALEREAAIGLEYSSRVVPVNKRVTVRGADLTVQDVLAEALQGTDIEPVVTGAGSLRLVRSRKQQTGRILGAVTDATTGRPIPGVQIVVSGTRHSAIADENGRYVIANVPPGTYTVEARSIGYAPAKREGVVVGAGDATVDLAMQPSAIHLEDLIVTGVVDPISAAKIPFSVGKVTSASLPVPAADAVSSIRGKVAGVSIMNSGTPGGEQYIQLRTPTTIMKAGAPMYVVDGVILSDESSLVDIDALDIESIEVVKGAAAASLYGSRAAAGVISITTKRGKDLPEGTTRVTVRSEFGVNDVPHRISLNQSHWYKTNENGEFIDNDGNVVRVPTQRAIADDRISDNPYSGRTYDSFDAFFYPGGFQLNSVSIAQNGGKTNFMASFSNHLQRGVLREHDGYERNTLRFNLDHRIRDGVQLSLSASHVRSHRDEVVGSPLYDLLVFPPDVDLGAKGPDGKYIPFPDSTINTSNPIWRQTSRENWTERTQTLLRGAISMQPLPWLRLEADAGYDRADNTGQTYTPRGTPTSLTGESTGEIRRDVAFADALNASASASVLHRFADRLTARVTLRGLVERQKTLSFNATARDLYVGGPPILQIGQARPTVGSQQTEIRSTGYFLQAGFDYDGKYIGDLLLRRDGSSLFGPENRWNNYYRAAFAYRLSEEPWWPFRIFDEFKLRASVGTAGGRPGFADQYETYLVSYLSATRSTLGNRKLRPSFTREVEVGADMLAFGRVALELTYAQQVSKDQIVQMPQPAATGYKNRWENAGTIEGYSLEAALRADLYRGRDLHWSVSVVADRARNKITEWDRPCFISGLTRYCEGYRKGDIYGYRFIRDVSELPAIHANSTDQFQVNDDGFLVPVGAGNSWRDGLAKGLWGTTVTIDGIEYAWGLPITLKTQAMDADSLVYIGSMAPDVKLGIGSTITWKGLTLYGLVDWQVGGLIHNATRQRLYQSLRAGDVDQSGKPDERKKPIDYYLRLGYTGTTAVEHFIEPGGYVKLREVSAKYTLPQSALARFGLSRLGVERVSIALIGRNLFTITDYTGFDPEVGSIFYRSDNFNYPNFRTFTSSIEVVF